MQAKNIEELDTPCFVVDLDKVKRNANDMKQNCENLNVTLRPHTKTHKTLEAALLQTNGKKEGIVVSTLAEAEFYAENGFDDILLAHPMSSNKMKRCLMLLQKLENFHVLVSNTAGLDLLLKNRNLLKEGKKWSIMLELDAGYGRTGFDWNTNDVIEAAVKAEESEHLILQSIYIHCGNSYDTNTKESRESLQLKVIERAKSIKNRLSEAFLKFPVRPAVPLTTGSTPTCSLPVESNQQCFSEFHPGNYIFYDYQQYLIGSCRQRDIACRVMTRVIDHVPRLNTIVVDCGFTALSKDGMASRPEDFCVIEGETNLKLIGMSQEIGKIVAKEGDLDCRKYPIGTILFIIPYHSCATAAMHPRYFVHQGSQVVDEWVPCRGW